MLAQRDRRAKVVVATLAGLAGIGLLLVCVGIGWGLTQPRPGDPCQTDGFRQALVTTELFVFFVEFVVLILALGAGRCWKALLALGSLVLVITLTSYPSGEWRFFDEPVQVLIGLAICALAVLMKVAVTPSRSLISATAGGFIAAVAGVVLVGVFFAVALSWGGICFQSF